MREALAERQIALRNAPHLVHVLPFLIPILTRDGLIDRRIARLLGGALWMYDLSGGLRIRRRIAACHATTRSPRCRPCDPTCVASAYLYFDAHADDARLTLALARTAAEHGAVVVNHAPAVGMLKTPAGRVSAGSSADDRVADGRDIDDRGAGRGERGRRLGRRSARARRGRASRRRCGRRKACTSPCRGTRCATRSRWWFRSPATNGRCSWCRGATHTYIGTTDTDYDGRHRRSAVHGRRRRVSVARRQPRAGRAAHRSGRHRHVGRIAPAAPLGHRGTHRRPLAPPRHPGVGRGRGHDHRRQAHDVPGDGRGHHRPGRPAARRAAPHVPHEAPHPRGRGRVPGAAGVGGADVDGRAPRSPVRHRGQRGAGTASHATPRSASRWCPGCRTCGPRRCSRCARRWPAPSTTCSTGGRGPGCSTATPRERPRSLWPGCSRPSSGWDDAAMAAAVAEYRAELEAERAASAPPPSTRRRTRCGRRGDRAHVIPIEFAADRPGVSTASRRPPDHARRPAS